MKVLGKQEGQGLVCSRLARCWHTTCYFFPRWYSLFSSSCLAVLRFSWFLPPFLSFLLSSLAPPPYYPDNQTYHTGTPPRCNHTKQAPLPILSLLPTIPSPFPLLTLLPHLQDPLSFAQTTPSKEPTPTPSKQQPSPAPSAYPTPSSPSPSPSPSAQSCTPTNSPHSPRTSA